MSSVEFKWMGDTLWRLKHNPTARYPMMKTNRQCVGQVRPHIRGTYWQAYLYMGNIRASFPTKQEAMDFLQLIARSNQ